MSHDVTGVTTAEFQDDHDEDTVEGSPLEFHTNCGFNIELSTDLLTAKRISGFNASIVLSRKPLLKNQMFRVKLVGEDKSWHAGVQIGVVFCNPEKLVLPKSAINIDKKCYLVQGSSLYKDGSKVCIQQFYTFSIRTHIKYEY